MQYFLLGIFLVRLALANTLSFGNIAASWLDTWKSFICIVVLTCLIASSIAAHQFITPTTITEASAEKTPQLIHSWEKIRELQPTHRDVLLNLSQLYQQMGNTTEATDLSQQAHELDPNYAKNLP